jgi:hypothetical protein
MGKNEMTEPTQAQIEAFDMAYLTTLYPDRHDFVASAGLQREAIIAGLTAAAKVGDTSSDPRWVGLAGQGIQIEFELRKELLTIEARTIERCAQVAGNMVAEVAAAIRKLKEEGK